MSDPNLDLLRAPFPATAIKQRQGGGGRMLDYVAGHTVIHRLNDACPAWDFAIVREWQEGNLLKAHVRLTIPGLGSREHVGVQVVTGRPGTEDVDTKGHITDGLKKAATLFGVALELYGPDYEAGEIDVQPRAQPRPQPRQTTPPVQQQTRPQASTTLLLTEPQRSRIWAMAGDKGHDDEAVHAFTRQHFGKVSVNDLTRAEASAVIDWLGGVAPPTHQPITQERQRGYAQARSIPEEPAHLRSAPDPDNAEGDRWTRG